MKNARDRAGKNEPPSYARPLSRSQVRRVSARRAKSTTDRKMSSSTETGEKVRSTSIFLDVQGLPCDALVILAVLLAPRSPMCRHGLPGRRTCGAGPAVPATLGLHVETHGPETLSPSRTSSGKHEFTPHKSAKLATNTRFPLKKSQEVSAPRKLTESTNIPISRKACPQGGTALNSSYPISRGFPRYRT